MKKYNKILKAVLISLCLVLVILIAFIGFNNSNDSFPTQISQGREFVEGVSSQNSHNHIHSIQYLDESDELYIATHMGLYGFNTQEESFFRLKNLTFDIMGFSISKSSPNIWYISGHSIQNPNIGLLKSKDYATTFNRVFDSLNIFSPTVDFHLLKTSPLNSSIVVGFYEDSIYVSDNEGEDFIKIEHEKLNSGDCYGAVCISLSPKNKNIVYAITNNTLYKSYDLAKTFEPISSDLITSVSYVLVNEFNTEEIFVAQENYISKFKFGPEFTFEEELSKYEINELGEEEVVTEMVQSEEKLYVLTNKSRIFSINLENSNISNIV